MKILIVNTYDTYGGAAKAAHRLHSGLLEYGIDSSMLVQMKKSDEYKIIGPSSNFQKALAFFKPVLDKIPTFFYKKRDKTYFSPAWIPSKNVINEINKIKPDIVHLHWINDGMIKIEDLAKINAPIIWSLHDMWAFTGGCHYDKECGGYKTNCGNCKILHSDKKNDLSAKIFMRKRKTYSKITNLTVVGLSRWLADDAKKSLLFKTNNIVNLPNPINTEIFKPMDKMVARKVLNLPQHKKLVFFGAVNAKNDPRKGFKELTEAIQKLKIDNIELVVFGSSLPENPMNFGFKTHYLGHLHDDISLVTLYSSADVIVVPSLQENLSNVIIESLACGLPVVAFHIGGNQDMIAHKTNGYLAKPFDITDLAYGIEWILKNKTYKDLSQNARNCILKKFSYDAVIPKYIKLYKTINIS